MLIRGNHSLSIAVVNNVRLADEVIASHASRNLEGAAKAMEPVPRFGHKGFDYAYKGGGHVDEFPRAHPSERQGLGLSQDRVQARLVVRRIGGGAIAGVLAKLDRDPPSRLDWLVGVGSALTGSRGPAAT